MQIQSPRITRRDLQSAPWSPRFLPVWSSHHACDSQVMAKRRPRITESCLQHLLEASSWNHSNTIPESFPSLDGPQKTLHAQLLPSLPTAFVPPSLPPPLVSLTSPTLPSQFLSFKATFSENSLILPRTGFTSAPPPGCILHFFFLFKVSFFSGCIKSLLLGGCFL